MTRLILLILIATTLTSCSLLNPCANRTEVRAYYEGQRGFTTEELPNHTTQFHPGGPQHGPQCVVVRCKAVKPTGRTDGY